MNLHYPPPRFFNYGDDGPEHLQFRLHLSRADGVDLDQESRETIVLVFDNEHDNKTCLQMIILCYYPHGNFNPVGLVLPG